MSKELPKKATLVSDKKRTPPIRRVIQIALLIVLLASAYVLFLQYSPQRSVLNNRQQDLFVATIPNRQDTNRLIIPKIATNSKIYSGDQNVLEKGTWHRWPERGNPKDGGNFILAAHRYVFGWLPQKTIERSILYNIDKLAVGDTILVDWEGTRYTYLVSEKKSVSPGQTEIEDSSKENKLTLYSCSLSGERDGREVIIARPQE